MPISHKHKTIFVHIPKTAGTSIENALGIGGIQPNLLRSHRISTIDGIRCAPQHLTCNMLIHNEICKPHWNTYFKFSFVRHPYTKVLSEYFWVKGKTKKDLKFNPKDFSKFLNEYYSVIDKDHKLSQYDYLTINGKLAVDFVGKFETLNSDFEKIKKKLGLHVNLPHTQKSSNKNEYINILMANQKNKIYNLYKKDFEFFSYMK